MWLYWRIGKAQNPLAALRGRVALRILRNTLGMAAFALALMAQGALAGSLTIANVNAQNIACVFNPSCQVSPNESAVYIKLFGDAGQGRVQSRIFAGVPSFQAAGMTAYLYRVDMTATMALGMANCVERMVLDAGPVAALPYSPPGAAEVFVISSGGPGKIGLRSATQNGGRITFTFAKPICPTDGSRPGSESFFFGFASRSPPVPAKAQLIATMEGVVADVRAPKH
jgi:hypothetical protein